MVADDRVREWAASLAALETSAFMRARRRFVRHPCAKHLRRLHGAARRLRSLFEDFRDVLPRRDRAGLRRLIEAAGDARRAAVARKSFRGADADERSRLQPLLRELRDNERRALRRVRRALSNIRYAS